MRRAWILIGLLGLMAVSSCSSTSCCDDRRMCRVPALHEGMCHGCAVAAIRLARFTKHPNCMGNPMHYDDYYLVDPIPTAGDEYPCGTELDLTFVSPNDKKKPPAPNPQ